MAAALSHLGAPRRPDHDGFFALTLAKLFFPAGDLTVSLLLTVATFGVGFIMRPVGALVLGTLADRRGRKVALSLTILLMALETAMIGLAPSYATVGAWASAIIVLARLIQGFSTTWLIVQTGSSLAPAWYVMLAAAISLTTLIASSNLIRRPGER